MHTRPSNFLFQACEDCDARRLRLLMPDLQEHSSGRFTTPFWHYCGGVFKETYSCLANTCDNTHSRYESFAFLPLAIDSDAIRNLEDAIFFHLEGDVPPDYRCSKCTQVNCTRRHTTIIKWPLVFVVGLKRWQVDEDRLMKIDRHISFETVLPSPDGNGPYHLRAVITHTGSAGSGHYTSCVRGRDNYWYKYDDARQPRRLPTQDVLRESGYFFIYERQ